MSPCSDCHAGCCRSFAIPVTGADVLRIQRDLGLSFWDFAVRWADPYGQIARNHAPHIYFEDEPETPFVICLKHEDSQFAAGTSKCQFLMEGAPDADHPVGVARCGIYHSRPVACRVFPTKLNDSGQLAVLYDVPERGRSGDDAAYTLCPRQWERSDVDSLQAVQDLVVAQHEMNFFHQLVALWNRNPGNWQVFPEFLTMVYSNRVVEESLESAHQSTIKMLNPENAQQTRAA